MLHVYGDLDLSCAKEFESDIVQACVEGKKLVIELTECRYIDSTILSALLRVQKAIPVVPQVVVSPGSTIDRIFKITNMHDRLAVLPSLNDALVD